jgi:hypothetical protein
VHAVTRSRILVAVVPEAAVRIERALEGEELRIVRTVEEALLALRTDRFRLAIFGVYFDESRMFELVPSARASRLNREMPVLCVLGIARRLSAAVVRGLEETVKAIGCSWLDISALPDDAAGNGLLREALLSFLPKAAPSSTDLRTGSQPPTPG